MTTIRPQGPTLPPPNPVRDARAAFFQNVAAPAPAVRQSPPAVAQTTAPVTAQPIVRAVPTTMPDRPLRPGSIIDIRV